MIDHKVEEQRQAFLERLYIASGRDKAEHPLHGLYTGLKQDIELVFKVWWNDSYPTPPGKHAIMTHVAFAQWLVDGREYNG